MPRSGITDGVDVRRYAAQKRAGLAAHRTDVFGRGRVARLFRALVRSPLPAFRIARGTEGFTEPGGPTGALVARGQTTRARSTGLVANFPAHLTKNPQVSARCQPPTPKRGL